MAISNVMTDTVLKSKVGMIVSNADFNLTNCTDGNITTTSKTYGYTTQGYIDFNKSVNLRRIYIRCYYSQIYVHGSDDKTIWTTIGSYGNNVYAWNETFIDVNVNYKYYKISTGYGNADSVISEINFYISTEEVKYLIRQNDQYYTIKPEYYSNEINNFIPITIAGQQLTRSEILNYGFNDINLLINNLTTPTKPLIKFNSNFEIKKYIVR